MNLSSMISPSRLDEFLMYKSGTNWNGDEYTLDSYIDRLLKIESPSSRHKINGGTAAHWVLEHLNYGIKLNSYQGVPVDGELWNVIFSANIELQLPVIRESWVRGNFAGVDIRGKVDAIDAVDVHDHQFTSQIDIDKYMSSMQWKMYLLMTGRDRFVYNLFTVTVEDDENVVTIKDYQRLVLTSYDGMAEEVEIVVSEYKDFLTTIKPLLEKRINEYNSCIDAEISRLSGSPLITIKDELITILQKNKLKNVE